MKRKITLLIVVLTSLFLLTIPAQAGGWAVITLDELPGQVRAGEPFTIRFAVRQHGVALTSSFGTPTILAAHPETGLVLTFESSKTKEEGYFTSEISLPETGTWNWKVDIFNNPSSAQTMPPLEVQAAGGSATAPRLSGVSFPMGVAVLGLGLVIFAGVIFYNTRTRWAFGIGLAGIILTIAGWVGSGQQPVAAAANIPEPYVSPAELGKALFQAKGCVVCHYHAVGRNGYTGIQTDIGPNLTGTKLPADYLRVWLKDPSAVKPETQMPNLNLKETEIEALAAFLTQEP